MDAGVVCEACEETCSDGHSAGVGTIVEVLEFVNRGLGNWEVSRCFVE